MLLAIFIGSDHWQDVNIRTYTSLAALSVLVYEYLTTLYIEVSLIWKRPVSLAKCLFVISRYLALICQITGQIHIFSIEANFPLSRPQCVTWHSFQTIVFQILLFVVECIQAMKVHALYSDCPKSLHVLHAFRALTFVMISYTTGSTLGLLSYDGTCRAGNIPWQVIGFSGIAITNQVVISVLTLSPKVMREKGRHSPLVAIMTRDSFFTFFAITTMLAVIISHAEMLAHVIPTVFITILSISGCRMITNILSTAERPAEEDDERDKEGSTVRSEPVPLSALLSLEAELPSPTTLGGFSQTDLRYSIEVSDIVSVK